MNINFFTSILNFSWHIVLLIAVLKKLNIQTHYLFIIEIFVKVMPFLNLDIMIYSVYGHGANIPKLKVTDVFSLF